MVLWEELVGEKLFGSSSSLGFIEAYQYSHPSTLHEAGFNMSIPILEDNIVQILSKEASRRPSMSEVQDICLY